MANSPDQNKSFSKRLLTFAWLLVVGLLIWLVLWLWQEGDATHEERIARIPNTTVKITPAVPNNVIEMPSVLHVSPTPTEPEENAPIALEQPETSDAPQISTDDTSVPDNLPAAPIESVATENTLAQDPQTPQDQSEKPTAPQTQQATQSATVDSKTIKEPLPALIENGQYGPLPVISADGLKPREVYAKPFAPKPPPIIAIVVKNLGLNANQTKSAIENLPDEVSLAFSPFAQNLSHWTKEARSFGHEFLIELPMEPLTFPESDPGPKALLTTLPVDKNLERLEWVLSRTTGYPGLLTTMGSKFSALELTIQPILSDLNNRGLFLVDSRTTVRSVIPSVAERIEMPIAESNRVIDQDPSEISIAARLQDLERIAARNQFAIGLANPYPLTIDMIRQWAGGLASKGIVLVPISSLAKTPQSQPAFNQSNE